jgi:hypothetical protein
MQTWDDFYLKRKQNQERFAFWAAVVALAIVILLSVGVLTAKAEVIVDLDAIAQIESSGCKNKISTRPGDPSFGCHQITPPTLQEFNSYNKKFYTKNDLLNDAISYEVAEWYLNKRIPQMIRYFGKPDTLENRLIAYNAGISYVKTGKPIPSITKKYLEKYARLTK